MQNIARKRRIIAKSKRIMTVSISLKNQKTSMKIENREEEEK